MGVVSNYLGLNATLTAFTINGINIPGEDPVTQNERFLGHPSFSTSEIEKYPTLISQFVTN